MVGAQHTFSQIQGILESVAVPAHLARVISLMNLLHLCFICGVATDSKIP